MAAGRLVSSGQSLAGAIDTIDTATKTAAAEAENISGATEERAAAMQGIAAASQHIATWPPVCSNRQPRLQIIFLPKLLLKRMP